jgi:hypothetical protein
MENRDLSCKERVQDHFESRIDDLRTLLKLYYEDCEAYDEDLGNLNEYGLSFDYTPAEDGEPGYFVYLISWGGPSEEFRFYVDLDMIPYKVEFWFKDWFDGAKHTLRESNLEFMTEFFTEYLGCGDPKYYLQYTVDKATE